MDPRTNSSGSGENNRLKASLLRDSVMRVPRIRIPTGCNRSRSDCIIIPTSFLRFVTLLLKKDTEDGSQSVVLILRGREIGKICWKGGRTFRLDSLRFFISLEKGRNLTEESFEILHVFS